jgi:enoyl-CoA hydratase/carnithine racemase
MTGFEMPPVLRSDEGRVAILTLNRGDQHNTLHPSLIHALSEQLARLRLDPEISTVVLTANGAVFCAGLDLAHLRTLQNDGRVRYMRSAFSLFEQLYAMPQPVVAAVNGPAVAGGFDLAMFCDLRVGVPTARFAQPEVILGATQFFFPAWATIGLGRAKELAFTGLPIDAMEAFRVGLLNHLVPAEELLTKALGLASAMAKRPRAALLASKRLSQELPGMEREAAFALMGRALDESLNSDEHRLALESYLQGGLKG